MDNHRKEVQTGAQAQHRLVDLIKDIRFAMITTRAADGNLHSHPMTTQTRPDDEDHLWFFMSRSSDVLHDIRATPSVNISYAHPGKDRYVSVSGTARVVDDRAIVEDLWNPMAQAWFPGGVQDPDLALVAVAINAAHYWEVDDSKVTQLFKMAKAALTGSRPTSMGDSVRVPSS